MRPCSAAAKRSDVKVDAREGGAFEIVMHLVDPAYPGVLHYGVAVFVPLWFLAVYTIVTLLTPATARRYSSGLCSAKAS